MAFRFGLSLMTKCLRTQVQWPAWLIHAMLAQGQNPWCFRIPVSFDAMSSSLASLSSGAAPIHSIITTCCTVCFVMFCWLSCLSIIVALLNQPNSAFITLADQILISDPKKLEIRMQVHWPQWFRMLTAMARSWQFHNNQFSVDPQWESLPLLTRHWQWSSPPVEASHVHHQMPDALGQFGCLVHRHDAFAWNNAQLNKPLWTSTMMSGNIKTCSNNFRFEPSKGFKHQHRNQRNGLTDDAPRDLWNRWCSVEW